MFCEKCGNKIEEGCRFCEKCGTPVAPLRPVSAGPQQPVSVQPQQPVQNMNYQQAPVNYQQPAQNMNYQQAPVNYQQPAQNMNYQQAPANYQQPAQNMNYQQNPDPNMSNASDPAAPGKGRGFKLSKKWIIIGVSAAAVVAIALVLLFSKRVKNTISRAVKSDEEYYQSVEGSWLKTAYTDVSSAITNSSEIVEELTASKYSFNADFRITNPKADFINEFCDNVTDIKWLEKAAAGFDVIIDDKKAQVKGEFSINKEKIMDIDFILDLAKGALYSGIPILSDKYLMADISSTMSSDESFDQFYGMFDAVKEVFPEKADFRIFDKYLDIITSNLTKVSLSDSSVSAGGVTQDCTKAVVKIDEKVQRNIIKAVCAELKKDTDVKNLIQRFEKNEVFNSREEEFYEEFLNSIDELLEDLDSDHVVFDTYKMTVSIDSKGDVIGRELKDEDGRVLFSYAYAVDGGSFGLKAFTERRNGEKDLEFTVSNGTISGHKISGTIKLSERSNEIFKLQVEDIDLSGIFDGKISGSVIFDLYKLIGSRELKGLDLKATLKTSSDSFSIKLEILEDDKGFAELELEASKKSTGKITIPTRTVEIDLQNPASDISDWFDGLDWKNVTKAAKAAKLPEEALEAIEELQDADFSTLFRNIGRIRTPRYDYDYYDIDPYSYYEDYDF